MKKMIFIFLIFILFSCHRGGVTVVEVKSEPEGADIYLDGEDTGMKTDTVIVDIEEGKHTIELKMEGYATYREEIEVMEGDTTRIEAVLTSLYGSLSIKSVPEGADIYLDDEDTGMKTDTVIVNIKTGKHKLKLVKEGYPEYEDTVEITGGDTSKIFVDFNNLTGVIRITSSPVGAFVFLDEMETGKQTPVTIDRVFPGKHFVRLRKAGYFDYTEEVEVKSGETTSVNGVLSYRTFVKLIENSEGILGRDVVEAGAGNYVILGRTNTSPDGWLAEVDGDGNELWERTFGGADVEIVNSLYKTDDGGYIFTGITYSYSKYAGFGDLWIVKVDKDGNQMWQTNIGNPASDEGEDVIQATDGNYVLTGWTDYLGEAGGGVYLWLMKVDRDGNKLWERTFGGGSGEAGYSLIESVDGGYVICGVTSSYGAGGRDVWLIKVDRDGNKLWDRTFGGEGDDIGYSLIESGDGGYVICGVTSSYGAGGKDVWLIKVDRDGNKLWERTFGGGSDDVGRSLIESGDGGYIICGVTSSYGAGGRDVWLIKVDRDGNKLWDRTFGNSNTEEEGYSVIEPAEGGYIVAGYGQKYPSGSPYVLLIRTDFDGNAEE